jgi:hypothetical protein
MGLRNRARTIALLPPRFRTVADRTAPTARRAEHGPGEVSKLRLGTPSGVDTTSRALSDLQLAEVSHFLTGFDILFGAFTVD